MRRMNENRLSLDRVKRKQDCVEPLEIVWRCAEDRMSTLDRGVRIRIGGATRVNHRLIVGTIIQIHWNF